MQQTRGPLLYAAAFFLLAAMLNGILAYSATEALRMEIQERLLGLAKTAALLTDGDAHQSITTPAQKDSAIYLSVQAPYRHLIAANPDLRYIYTNVMVDGKAHFIIDTQPAVIEADDGTTRKDTAAVMELYEDPSPYYWRALNERLALVEPKPYSDSWGTFLSAYAPFYNSKNEFIGTVGVDINAKTYLKEVNAVWRMAALGTIFALLVSVTLFYLITSKRKAELLQQERIATILEEALDASIQANASGEIIAWNRQAQQLFQWHADEIIGQAIDGLFLRNEVSTLPLIRAETFTELVERNILKRRIVHTAKRRNGSTFPAEISLSPIRVGNRLEFSMFVRDITELKEAEEARIAKDRAEAANIAKSGFLSNMSHELRTPLNSIIGMTHLMLKGKVSADQREMLEVLEQSSLNLLEIVNDILDISKIEANKVELERIPFDARKKILGIVNMLLPVAGQKKLGLTLHAADEAMIVLGDPTRYAQIATNLISNAIKYTSSGAVDVMLTTQPLDQQMILLRLDVADTGIGIQPDKLESIFDKFSQADASTTRKYGGTGLGLAITRQLTERMGGKITVASRVGEGSTFSVAIPFASTHEVPVEKSLPALTSQGILKPENVRVLVVEDHALNQAYMKRMLPAMGLHHFTIANNGKECLIELSRQQYDVILMDCFMPEMNGYETTKAIRTMELALQTHIPIVAMTANAMVGEREKCIECGMDDYISKPATPTALARILSRWIKFPEAVTA